MYIPMIKYHSHNESLLTRPNTYTTRECGIIVAKLIIANFSVVLIRPVTINIHCQFNHKKLKVY